MSKFDELLIKIEETNAVQNEVNKRRCEIVASKYLKIKGDNATEIILGKPYSIVIHKNTWTVEEALKLGVWLNDMLRK